MANKDDLLRGGGGLEFQRRVKLFGRFVGEDHMDEGRVEEVQVAKGVVGRGVEV